MYAKYSLKMDVDPVKTKSVGGTNNPDWRLERQYDLKSLTEEVKVVRLKYTCAFAMRLRCVCDAFAMRVQRT